MEGAGTVWATSRPDHKPACSRADIPSPGAGVRWGEPATERLLRSFEKQDPERLRHIKIGSVLIREHEGKRHEVIAVPGGFLWEGRSYESRSIIANKIAGTRWNGPRFFGLRDKRQPEEQPADGSSSLPEMARRQPGPRSSSVNARHRYPDEACRS